MLPLLHELLGYQHKSKVLFLKVLSHCIVKILIVTIFKVWHYRADKIICPCHQSSEGSIGGYFMYFLLHQQDTYMGRGRR